MLVGWANFNELLAKYQTAKELSPRDAKPNAILSWSALREILAKTTTACRVSGKRAKKDEYPPVAPLCQVMLPPAGRGSMTQNIPLRRFGLVDRTPGIAAVDRYPGAVWPSR